MLTLSLALNGPCPNCLVDFPDGVAGLMRHLQVPLAYVFRINPIEMWMHLKDGAECLKMRRFAEPVIHALERMVKAKQSGEPQPEVLSH